MIKHCNAKIAVAISYSPSVIKSFSKYTASKPRNDANHAVPRKRKSMQNGNNMIEITVTETIKKIASWSAKVKQRTHIKGGNYTGLEEDGAYYHGTIGELSVYKFLRENRIKSEYCLNLTGKADNGDFVIWGRGTPVVTDLKTAAKKFHKKIMITKDQYARHKRDIYLGAKLNGDIIELWGYNRGIQGTTEQNYGAPSYNKLLTELIPIETLLERADRSEATAHATGNLSQDTIYKLNAWFNLPI